MKIFIAIVLSLLSLSLQAQEVREWKEGKLTWDDFFVLEDDNSISNLSYGMSYEMQKTYNSQLITHN